MKKTILVLVVLALLIPASAFAATEFSLGGFIRLDSYWDSTQTSVDTVVVKQRNNDALFHHGQFNMTAAGSRFNFTIKGPKLWGATTTGFIEGDFDTLLDNNFSGLSGAVGAPGATHSYVFRLRHAMFKLNWPDTELLFGQYWGYFSEYYPEVTGEADFQWHGWANQRVPQIRLTQKFAGDWTVSGMIAQPFDPNGVDVNFTGATVAGSTGNQLTSGLEGRSAETPQLQAKLAYEADLWGKAPFYGRPRGFVAQVNGGWQRTRYRNNVAAAGLNTFGQNAFGTNAVIQKDQQYLDPWLIQGTLFVPVLPTYSNNLAGSASVTAEGYIGQGASAFGMTRDQDNSWLDFSGRNAFGQFFYNRKLTNQVGGYIQGQYYFTNQWFINIAWGLGRNYGFDTGTSALLAGQQAANLAGYKYASNNDQTKLWQEYDLTLWYRPIEALKFGLQYAYERTDFLQAVNNPVVGAVGQAGSFPSAGATNMGDSHRIQFVAFMFF